MPDTDDSHYVDLLSACIITFGGIIIFIIIVSAIILFKKIKNKTLFNKRKIHVKSFETVNKINKKEFSIDDEKVSIKRDAKENIDFDEM